MQSLSPAVTSRHGTPPYDPAADIVRPYHIRHATGISETTAWRYRQKGQFPEPLRLTDGTVGWRRADINAWLDSRCVHRHCTVNTESAPTRSNGARR